MLLLVGEWCVEETSTACLVWRKPHRDAGSETHAPLTHGRLCRLRRPRRPLRGCCRFDPRCLGVLLQPRQGLGMQRHRTPRLLQWPVHAQHLQGNPTIPGQSGPCHPATTMTPHRHPLPLACLPSTRISPHAASRLSPSRVARPSASCCRRDASANAAAVPSRWRSSSASKRSPASAWARAMSAARAGEAGGGKALHKASQARAVARAARSHKTCNAYGGSCCQRLSHPSGSPPTPPATPPLPLPGLPPPPPAPSAPPPSPRQRGSSGPTARPPGRPAPHGPGR